MTEKHFTPNTKSLAIVAKAYCRERAAMGDVYPPSEPNSRTLFFSKLLHEAAQKAEKDRPKNDEGVESFPSILKRASKDKDTYAQLITFVGFTYLLSVKLITDAL